MIDVKLCRVSHGVEIVVLCSESTHPGSIIQMREVTILKDYGAVFASSIIEVATRLLVAENTGTICLIVDTLSVDD